MKEFVTSVRTYNSLAVYAFIFVLSIGVACSFLNE